MRHEKGMLFISALLIISVLSTFALALFSKSVTTYRATERVQNQIRAFHFAESAMDQAIVKLRDDPNYKGTGDNFTAVESTGSYQIKVEDVSPTLKRITATGHAASDTSSTYAYQKRVITTYVDVTPNTSCNFSKAILGTDQVYVNGTVDGYSSAGSAGPVRPVIAATRAKDDAITINRYAGVAGVDFEIMGKGITQSDADAALEVASGVKLSGSVLANPTTYDCPAPAAPSSLTSQGRLRLNPRERLELPGGTYLYSQIRVGDDAELIFTGPATVYVKADMKSAVDIKGTMKPSSCLPKDLVVKVIDGRQDENDDPYITDASINERVRIKKGGDFLGVIDAPKSKVVLREEALVHGAVVAEDFRQMKDSFLHYDVALKDLSSAGSGGGSNSTAYKAKIKSWVET